MLWQWSSGVVGVWGDFLSHRVLSGLCMTGKCRISLERVEVRVLCTYVSGHSSAPQWPCRLVAQDPSSSILREELFTKPAFVFGCCHGVAHCSRVYEDRIVIVTWHSFVSKEVNGLKTIISHLSQAASLIPSIRKDIKADLASYGKREAFSWNLLLQIHYEILSYVFFFIKFVELNAFSLAAASSNRGHIQHPISEFSEVLLFFGSLIFAV